MTKEQFYEMIGNIGDNYIIEAKEICKKKPGRHFPAAAAAALAVCLCITGITVLAEAESLKGFFKDIRRWDGAVIGSTYEQATEEVNVQAVAAGNVLSVELHLLNPDAFPYREFDSFGIQSYEIIDEQGETVIAEENANMNILSGSLVTIPVFLDSLPVGSYTLHIYELVGSSKADQPLILHGDWKCKFIAE